MSAVQHWTPERYLANASFVAEMAEPLVELLSPKPGEMLMDLGCGDGRLTQSLVDRGCLVEGVDSSPELVAAARKMGLDVRLLDGRDLDYRENFEAVFSNTALHWMKPPERVLDGVYAALKPGGRFIGEFGGHGNVALVRSALYTALERHGINARTLDPWFFPTMTAYRSLLVKAGFVVDTMEFIDRPTLLPGDFTGWLETFAESFTGVLPKSRQFDFILEVQEMLHSDLCCRGQWHADYVRLRFSAHKTD